MKKLLFLLVLVSTFAFGQPKGLWRKYVDIPNAPAQTSPVTITPANHDGGGNQFFTISSLMGSSKSGKTSGNFSSGFDARSPVGTVGAPYIFVNTAGDQFGSAGVATHGITSITDADYYNWYGLSATAPLLVTGGSGANGFALNARAGGSHHVIQNAVINAPNSSGLSANNAVNGTNYYETFDGSFLRVFNAGQEGFYLINTTGTTTTPNYGNIFNLTNCFTYTTSREGFQGEHINVFKASHNTVVLAGQTGGAAQNNACQGHDLGPGSRYSYNIFDGSPVAFNLFTHCLRIDHNYFSFTLNFDPGDGHTINSDIGRTDNAIWNASARLTGDTVIVENNYFNFTGAGTLEYFTLVELRDAVVIFRNNTFSPNITHIMKDQRAVGFTNTLIGDIGNNGNVSASITAPIYVTGYNDPNNYLYQGLLVTSSPYYSAHMGYRTP